MTTTLAFLDCETTSLRFDRRAWEIGIIARAPQRFAHPDGPDTFELVDVEHHWFIDADDLDLGNADLMSLKVGRFFERHPQYRLDQETDYAEVAPEADALAMVEAITRGAHIVGAVPNFDTETLGARMRAHGICPSWHYHLIDCEALAIGYLSGAGWPKARFGDPEAPQGQAFDPSALPWDYEALSVALGVSVPVEDRHSALGDARWCRALYDAIMRAAA